MSNDYNTNLETIKAALRREVRRRQDNQVGINELYPLVEDKMTLDAFKVVCWQSYMDGDALHLSCANNWGSCSGLGESDPNYVSRKYAIINPKQAELTAKGLHENIYYYVSLNISRSELEELCSSDDDEGTEEVAETVETTSTTSDDNDASSTPSCHSHEYDMRAIMTTAWSIARMGAKDHGGSARQYIASALQIVWREAREALNAIEAVETTSTTSGDDDAIKTSYWTSNEGSIDMSCDVINLYGWYTERARNIAESCHRDNVSASDLNDAISIAFDHTARVWKISTSSQISSLMTECA